MRPTFDFARAVDKWFTPQRQRALMALRLLPLYHLCWCVAQQKPVHSRRRAALTALAALIGFNGLPFTEDKSNG